MKRIALIGIVLGALAFAGIADAITGPQAVRHIRQYVAEDCYSYPAFRCDKWGVENCYKISARKVRCSAWQQYRVRRTGAWRECAFKVAAVERRSGGWVDLHFGFPHCQNEAGEPV